MNVGLVCRCYFSAGVLTEGRGSARLRLFPFDSVSALVQMAEQRWICAVGSFIYVFVVRRADVCDDVTR